MQNAISRRGCEPEKILAWRAEYVELCLLSREMSDGYPAFVTVTQSAWMFLRAASGIASLIGAGMTEQLVTISSLVEGVAVVMNVVILVCLLTNFGNATCQVRFAGVLF